MPISTQCHDCIHYIEEFKCKAFPKGIPREIFTGLHDHKKKFKGDNGIRFQTIEDFIKENKPKK